MGYTLTICTRFFFDCGDKIVEQKGEVELMKEEMGRDYLHPRVDVLNMQQRFEKVEKQIQAIALLVVGLVVAEALDPRPCEATACWTGGEGRGASSDRRLAAGWLGLDWTSVQ
ncbi:unnamed protein product [Lactuca saligna]|uniref:Uncharacterized protein n=1 Tax=Lactuca saligna TaxID=75948 RepID=A0AA36E819_LACSI|nr:unnamed protein product [Lactuca saligna]